MGERETPQAAVSFRTESCTWHTSLLPYSIVHTPLFTKPWHQVGGGHTRCEQQEVGPRGHVGGRPPQHPLQEDLKSEKGGRGGVRFRVKEKLERCMVTIVLK